MMSTINFEEANLRRFLEANDKFDMRDVPVERVASQHKQKRMVDMSVIKNQEVKAEYIDLLVSLFCRGNPYVYFSRRNATRAILNLPYFLADRDSFVGSDRKELIEAYKKCDFRTDRNIINSCVIAVILYRDKREDLFEKDIWDLAALQNRKISSMKIKRIDFSVINNTSNKELIKKYVKYLLGMSTFSDSMMATSKDRLFEFVRYLGDKNIADVVSSDVSDFLSGRKQQSQYNHLIYSFFEYLISHKLYSEENPVSNNLNWVINYNKNTPIPTEYVIGQIMGNLHKADETSKLIFLISYSTGMRISDICFLTKDCLEYDGKGGYYINFYCKKMRGKPESCLISKALFERIRNRISALNNSELATVYLFPSEANGAMPYCYSTYIRKFKKYCLPCISSKIKTARR